MKLAHVWVIAILCVGTAHIDASLAAPVAARQAAELLIRSVAANLKCGILSGTEAEELSIFANRAEQRLLQQKNAKMAKSVIAKGTETGNAVRCDETTANAVRGVLAAAKAANEDVSSLLRGSVDDGQAAAFTGSVVSPQIQEPPLLPESTTTAAPAAIEIERTEPVATVSPVVPPKRSQKKSAEQPKAKPVSKRQPAAKRERKPEARPVLSAYARLAEVYYLQRRCRTLSNGTMAGMYQKVLATHRTALRTNPASSVARTLRAAEARASQQGC